MSLPTRRALYSLAVVGALSAGFVWGQTTSNPAPITLPATIPAASNSLPALSATPSASLPTTIPASSTPLWTPPSTPSATSPALPNGVSAPQETVFTQPFVAAVTGDRVYVRSGPDKNAYEIGQLTKNDLIYVVGAVKGWYQILPPNGSFCLIAKEYVELDPGNASGTVKGDYINVRAGTAIYKTRDSSVMTTLRKGTKLKVVGSTDTYYQIAPPEKVYFYITPQYVKAAGDVAYKVPDLKLPQGVTGPSGVTVEAPTTLPTTMATLVLPETLPGTGTTTGTGIIPMPTTSVATGPTIELPGSGGGTGVTGGTTVAATKPDLPPLVPAVKFSETATARFNDVNTRYQAEAKKPVADQNLGALLTEFKEILAMENVSPSVQTGTQADITAIERTQTVQRLIKEQAVAQESTKKQTDALQQQYEEAQRAIAAARTAGPYSAEGLLQSSTIVQGKYALVNPQTNRVVAYVDPGASSIDLSIFIGKYIGVRGITRTMENSDVKVISVSNATLMPTPDAGKN